MKVLLVGGTSEIGLAIVRRLAPDRAFLLGRDEPALARAGTSLGQSSIETDLLDAEDCDRHAEAIGAAFESANGFDVVVLAVGVLGAQSGLDASAAQALEVMRVNFLGAGSLLLECLKQLRDRGSGTLVVLSSVAAERPRASNPVYGAAKAGLDALAQGLADAAAADGVRVLVVRPGFVRTRMTAGLKPAPFATTAEAVAEATAKALRSGRTHTLWVPGRLRFVFSALRHLPRPIWRKLSV
jgi:decaprenylphospho-beta-D-erythro-pentofuranosid-2-ulose 2-reductase